MKALVSAGGRGTRLRPITHTLNKHLIPIANKPMIFWVLEKIAKAKIKEVGIVIKVGDEEIKKAIGDGKKWNLKITYIPQIGGSLGLAHVVKVAEDFIKKEPFIFYLGDNIFLGEINKFIDKFKRTKVNCLLALSKVKDPQRFGVPEIKNGKIIKIEEKPARPKSNFAVTGIYLYDYHIFEAVKAIKPSKRGELEISDAHTWFIKKGYKIGYEEITGWWKDTGKPEDLLEGNHLLLTEISPKIKGRTEKEVILQGKVRIDSGSSISGKCLIRGPVIIGEGCTIINSYIGPYTSIGNNVEIYNTEIENSIILDNVDINCSTRIVDSLLGSNSTVISSKITLPSGHRLIIGDHALVEL